MSVNSFISLINLSKQLPFEIDSELKKQICFSETLVISCGHYEGDIGEESTTTEFSCRESTESEPAKEVKSDLPFEVKDKVEEEESKETSDNEDDFHIFFFPDCNKPLPPQDSKQSVLIVDGFPKINEALSKGNACTCGRDESGRCTCYSKMPCSCGAVTTIECTCADLKKICICHEDDPHPVCVCRESKVCVCHPDEKPRPVCTCSEIGKPCICQPDRLPFRTCECKYKPTFLKKTKTDTTMQEVKEEDEEAREENEEQEEEYEELDEQTPCVCQAPDPIQHCLCLKGKECLCQQDTCICGVRKTCVCEPTDSMDVICRDDESKSICSCDKAPKECTCDIGDSGSCKCFPKPLCTCGDPDNCKCKYECECTYPCVCDTQPKQEDECTCLKDNKKECTCSKKEDQKGLKLKKVRAGKHGYRWCHDVDPKHTFFDYGYGRHDKISYNEKPLEHVNIMGLHDEKANEDVCEVHGVKAPPYKKQVRRPSLDCCSAVGGISISVETLGEDQSKFLVQVISHSTKEGAKTGTKLVSIVDINMHTLEENRSEHITKKDKTKERRSYMAICDTGYYNKCTCICGDRNVVKRFYHTFDDAKEFLLEGANVVLMRYFGLSRYRGNVKTDTVLISGEICESIYVCQGVSQAIVNGKPLFVVKVERHIIEPNGNVHQTLTVLTLRGYMVSHEWADSNYIMHLNPLLNIIPEKDEIEQHAPLRKKWREDLQLFSDYLDFKSARTAEGGRYVVENGSLTSTLKDYLQALLMLKPADAIHFTRHYFASTLSALDLPHNEFFASTLAPSVYAIISMKSNLI